MTSPPARSSLEVLAGERLRAVGRAGMVWFSFGEPCEISRAGGGTRIVNTYALHIACPFRLRIGASVLVASSDLWAAVENPGATPREYDCDPIGAAWFDPRAHALTRRLEAEDLYVRRVQMDAAGGFVITLDGDMVLEAMPVASFPHEYWRFFEPGTGKPHLVFDQE